jgi:hypothetical protein
VCSIHVLLLWSDDSDEIIRRTYALTQS